MIDKKSLTTADLTAVALIAFAANSVFYRLALAEPTIDPASYTAVRLVSGVLTLWIIAGFLRRSPDRMGYDRWPHLATRSKCQTVPQGRT